MAPAPELGTVRLAILDSDTGFVRVLAKRAGDAGWEVRRLEAPPAEDELPGLRAHALVVDLALLRERAWEFLANVRAAGPATAVIVCTSRSTVAQRVRGLRAGADDWVTKPCHPEEVLARAEAVLRRRARTADRANKDPVLAGELEVRVDQFQALVGGRSVVLTRREFEVLERDEIYHAVWGYSMAHGDRSVDVFIRKVRQKLEMASPGWEYLHTHFGVGYRFDPVPRGETAPMEDAATEAASLPDPGPDAAVPAGDATGLDGAAAAEPAG